ncbi:MAG: sensor histidine kinase [Nocardioidaceae bacterium]
MRKWLRRRREKRARTRDTAVQDARTVAMVRRVGRLVPRDQRSWDVFIWVSAAALFALSWPTLFASHDVPSSLAPLVAAIGVLPVLLIRTNPLAAWALTTLAAVGIAMAFPPLPAYAFPWQPMHFLVMLATLVAVTLTCPWKQVFGVWLATVAVVAVFMPPGLKPGWIFGVSMVTATAGLLRGLLLSRRQLARQEELSELERARRAVLEERSRIARDLHDVVAHRMSLVVVQAQTASRRLEGVPPHVEQELDSIAEQAREALNEVRGMLGVLRSDGRLPETAPQPSLDEVEPLLTDTRSAGVDLEWSITGDPSGCSDAAGMVVFRILQESLANASRHAPGAHVFVDIGYDESSVSLSVVNGPATSEPPTPSGRQDGAGIIGMVTRAQAIGGWLEAAPTDDGGFVVQARIPKQATGSLVPPSRATNTAEPDRETAPRAPK